MEAYLAAQREQDRLKEDLLQVLLYGTKATRGGCIAEMLSVIVSHTV